MYRRVLTAIGEYPGEELTIENRQKSLYHYTTLESFLKIWVTRKLLFSDASRMNDILESHKNLSVPIASKDLWDSYYDIVHSYKQISLTMDYDSYLKGCMSRMMWGHYGQKGEGVCIELDPEKLDLTQTLAQPIVYSNTPLSLPILPRELNTPDEIGKYVFDNKDLFFFTKTEDWIGENEYRIVSNTLDSLDISKAIKCVYVTSSTSLTCQCVEAIVKNEVPVMFFHHNKVKDWLVPIVTSTVAYRESMHPRKENNSIILQNGQIAVRTTNPDGTVTEEIKFGTLTITPQNKM